MSQRNCVDTIGKRPRVPSTQRPPSLTWRGWFFDAQHLILGDARRIGVTFGVAWHVWRFRLRSRRALAKLDARMLRDIGVTFAQANRECAKKFWEP